MRGVDTAAEETLRLAIERHHPSLVMACSFQKEESVLIDMLMRIEPTARVFTIDTGVLFPETYEVWRKVEDRYGLQGRGGGRHAAERHAVERLELLRQAQGGRARAGARGRGRLDHRDPARAVAHAGGRPGGGMGRGARGLEVQSARRVDATATSGATSTSTISPTIPSTIGAMSRSAAPPAPSPATAARAAGPGRTRPSAACTYDTAHMSISPAPPILRRDEDLSYEISHLRALESEAIHVIREVAAELERAVLLFSGGKDSAVLLHLARKAFHPGALPFPVMHVDTGHNFPEVIEYRDRMVEELGARLIVASVQDSIDSGRVVEENGPRASRNRLQSVTLLDAIEEHGFKAAFGGARRDEERARAKERILSFRDDFGQWDPKGQRPELWNLYNGFVKPGEHVRVFPLSNWTELDVWQYIAEEKIELPPIYFAHEREVFKRDGMLYAVSEFVELLPDEEPFEESVRFRTVGDMSCTGAVASKAATLQDVVAEIAATRITERGETRADDRISEAAMEDRKKEGYF